MKSRNWFRSPWMLSCAAILFGLLLLQPVPILAQDDKSDDFGQRLKKLEELIEAERVKNKIPGLAIAVVKDGKVVLAKGFGLSNLESKTPVDEETLFAIGSSTKSFTSTLVAMLVDEGKMDWDDPVTKYLPEFKMDVDTGDKEITVRDLLCHRTGFTRMGLIWASGSRTRDEVIQQAAEAKPYSGFQEDFLYNNVMYMTSGVCAASVMDSSWDKLIAEKIFQPLGMEASSTSISVAQKDDRLSLGYMWDKDEEEFIQLPMRNLDSIGPSGSINSNVSDMAKWIRFHLANGKFDGKQLIGQEARDETWSKQMEMGGGTHYGLGWMLRDWNGMKVVEHGGNIDGFSAQVTLLPELDAGYVILANVTVSPLQGASIGLVFDTLFGEAQAENSMAGIDTSELLGNYIANFGPFDNATMEVKMVDGKVAIDVPGQMAYELKAPDEDGKWFFAATDQIAVEFNRDENDKIMSVTMHQAGTTPEFILEDYDIKPDLPLAETSPLLGKYQDEEGKDSIKVELRKGRLTVDTGGSGTFVFAPPKEGKEKWSLRAMPAMIQLRFNKDDDGKVVSLTRFQGGKESDLLRVEGEDAVAEVPDVDELLKKMRSATGKLDEGTVGLRLKGKAVFVHQGVTGRFEQVFASDGRHMTTQDFGKMAQIVELYDGEKALGDSTIGRQRELHGSDLAMMKFRSPIWIAHEWNELYTDVQITGDREVDGKQTFEVTFSGGEDVIDRTVYVDPETGFVLREKVPVPNDVIPGLTATATYGDYQKVGGVMIPFKSGVENPMMGSFEMIVESTEVLKELDQDAFKMPKLKK